MLLILVTAALAMSQPSWSAFPYDGFVPEGGEGVHDPAVIEFDGHYFCFHTGPGIGFFRTSDDLIHWKVQGPIIPESPAWLRNVVPHNSVWAPEAVRQGKGLRLYYCASARFGHNDSWIGVADCPQFNPLKPKEGWQDLGPLISSKDGQDNFNAIDPDVLVGPDGKNWMYFGSYWSGLYAVEIDPASGKIMGDAPNAKVLIARNPADRANGLEAPCCVYHDGFYYLFLNYGLAAQGVSSTYQVVVGRSQSPTGPFLDSSGKAMTEGGHEEFLDSSSPMFGPGGGVEFKDDHGKWLMSCHYYDGRKSWHDHVWGLPTLQVRELNWSPDGWPVPGLPITPETIKLSGEKRRSPVGKWIHQADFGRVLNLDVKVDGTCDLEDGEKGTYTVSGDDLEFRWNRLNDPGEFWVDKVQLSNGGNYFVGRNQSRKVVRAVRAEKK